MFKYRPNLSDFPCKWPYEINKYEGLLLRFLQLFRSKTLGSLIHLSCHLMWKKNISRIGVSNDCFPCMKTGKKSRGRHTTYLPNAWRMPLGIRLIILTRSATRLVHIMLDVWKYYANSLCPEDVTITRNEHNKGDLYYYLCIKTDKILQI